MQISSKNGAFKSFSNLDSNLISTLEYIDPTNNNNNYDDDDDENKKSLLSSFFIGHAFSSQVPSLTLQLTIALKNNYEQFEHHKNLNSNNFVKINRNRIDGSLELGTDLPLFAGRYKYIGIIGKGTFSQLISAEDTLSSTKKKVAIKILIPKYFFIGIQEIKKLMSLNKADPYKIYPIIRLITHFWFFGYLCIVLELLHSTLLKEIQSSIFITRLEDKKEGLSINSIRKVAFQLLTALSFLKDQKLIHADLKPENILIEANTLLNENNHSKKLKIRICDFGNAIFVDEREIYFEKFEVQSLFYRAPEIVFGLPFGIEVDMWSVGCILVEIYGKVPLFQCNTIQQLLESMESQIGLIPTNVFKKGKFFDKYFSEDFNPRFKREKSLDIKLVQKLIKSRDEDFVDFVMGMLEYDPKCRITINQAFKHPFLTKLQHSGNYSTVVSDHSRLYEKILIKKNIPTITTKNNNLNNFLPKELNNNNINENIEEEEEEEEEEEDDGVLDLSKSTKIKKKRIIINSKSIENNVIESEIDLPLKIRKIS